MSDNGDVRSAKTLRMLKPQQHRDGYLQVQLYREGKRRKFYVHVLVGRAFVPKEPRHEVVNHKDGVKRHNAATNLEWSTKASNTRHAINTGLQRKHSIATRWVQGETKEGTGICAPSASEAERLLRGRRTSEITKAIARNRTAYGMTWCKLESTL